MLSRIARTLWGEISRDEFKKFGLLSAVFFLIIGSYWTLRVLKDSLFIHLVGPTGLPYAKMVSLVSLIVLLLFYNKLVDLFEKTKLVYIISFFYGVLYLIISFLLMHPTIGVANATPGNDRILGWVIYVSVESFGSIVVALFWSFVASVMDPQSAKRGYPVIVSGAQLGSILGTLLVMTQVSRVGEPILFGCAAITVLLVPFMLKRFHAQKFDAVTIPGLKEEKKATGIIEGLKLIMTKPYLMGILVVSTVYEIIGFLFEFQMKYQAKIALGSLNKVTEFIASYGLAINCLSFLFALIGTSLFIRKLGLTGCLIMYPSMIACMVILAWNYPGLWMFFATCVALKGISYALNNPCKEIMYIPTSRDVKFKAKSWIDVQGSRSAKGLGASIGALFPVMSELLVFGSIFSLGVIAVWIPIAFFVGRTNQRLVQEGRIIE